jgi:hypothetical protein
MVPRKEQADASFTLKVLGNPQALQRYQDRLDDVSPSRFIDSPVLRCDGAFIFVNVHSILSPKLALPA